MNLSGKALDVYNKAYEELMKINESKEDDSSPSAVYENSHEMSIYLYNQEGQSGAANGSATRMANNNKGVSRESFIGQFNVAIEHSPGIRKLFCQGMSQDENSNGDGVTEKQLIKQNCGEDQERLSSSVKFTFN
ncbi:uncharacterized protein LOC130015321 [Mercurialis annua]|uniref:uncharacterized protein LOC130015321 n=1 Tax=Mercurialis annua TaxID=3986 RepID=UPI0024AD7F9F|nr:uncharacterized protein LOC130015321 [Mercurialis annua]XP_055961139.1 uncharacterized protein LOC130015321 [Mercurialis annua]